MTQEEFYNLYDKIRDVLYGFKSYHCWYFCCNEEYCGNSMSFEVHVNSDKGDGDEWVESWSIDDKGRIYSEDAIYENYEEFLREWQ
jgi:hypothetical protein